MAGWIVTRGGDSKERAMADDRGNADAPDSPRETSLQTIVPEVLEAVRSEGTSQVNINILLQQVSEREPDPDRALEQTARIMVLTRQFEEHRLQAFKERANAIIDVKTRDPDEVEKRRNNRVRRCLKFILGAMVPILFGGAIACVLWGGSVLVAGMLSVGGAVSLAMLGPLATGESVSSTDVVRIVNAIRGMIPESAPKETQPQGRKGKQR
jgi:hypothetical protein